MKSLIKKIIPKSWLCAYHFLFAKFANFLFGSPSKNLIVIGITGTKGKTSSANFIWSVLQAGGIKTGILSTANIRIGEIEEDNNFHMTMPGRFFVQKTLSRMVKAGCEVAIVETTSQGIEQFRHIGVRYDIGIFTNLTPEHIDSHGSFDNYRQAKGKMFDAISKYPQKLFRGKEFKKIILANADSDDALYFLGFNAKEKKTYSIINDSDFKVASVRANSTGSMFQVGGFTYEINLPGQFNVYNALPAIAIGAIFDIAKEKVNEGLISVSSIAGRMEEVHCDRGFRVFVDYAHEPAGLRSVIETANQLKGQNSQSIVLIGCAGGGRDKARRKTMGSTAGQSADIVIVSDDEPYEEDPVAILQSIKEGAIEAGKVENKNLFVIADRLKGIRCALKEAHEGDVIVFTGLGHQKVRMIGKLAVSWNDKDIVEKELNNLSSGYL